MLHCRIAFALVLLVPAPRSQCAAEWQSLGPFPGGTSRITNGGLWDPDGPGPQAAKLVVTGPEVLFSVVAKGIAAQDLTTGEWSAFGSGMNGEVHDLAVLPNGDLVAAGEFTTAGGVLCNGIARWDGTTWHAFGQGLAVDPQRYVEAVAVMPNGDIIAGGRFQSSGNGAPGTYGIARWDGSTWSSLGGGLPWGYVLSLTVRPQGDLVVGGSFGTIGGVAANDVARWDGTAWHPLGAGMTSGVVYALLALPNGDVIAGGSLVFAGGARVARWDGTTWLPLGGGVNNIVYDLELLSSGDVVAGGTFTLTGNGPALRVARWDGQAWWPLGSGPPGQSTVRALVGLPSGQLFAGGHRGSSLSVNAAWWDGAAWALPPGTNGPGLAAVGLPGGQLVVGGGFTRIGSVETTGVASFDGTSWSAMGAGINGAVASLAVLPSGDLIAAGTFTMAGGVPANRIARWDGAAWSPLGAGLDGTCNSLAVLPNGDLLAGGEFFHAGQQYAPFVARWDGTSWSGFGTFPNWHVDAVAALPNGDFVVGGGLTSAGGVPCNRIARFNGTTWSPLGSGTSGWVHGLTVLPNGDVVATGLFGAAGGIAVNGAARWDGTAWHDMDGATFRPVATTLVPNGDLMAGGVFESGGRVAIARWDGVAWSAVSSELDAGVESLAVLANGDLAVGGRFVRAGDEVSPSIAVLSSTCPATASPIATTCVGPAGPVVLTADSLPWVGTTFGSTATGFTANAIAVSLLGLTSPSVPLTWLWPNTLPGCDQLASQEAILLHLPQAGSTSYSFAIPNAAVFAGLPLFHQFLHFEVSAQNQLLTLSSSNGLALLIGAFQ